MRFGLTIKNRRKQLGITQQILAESVGMKQCQISRLESNQRDLKGREIVKLAEALKLNVTDLI